MKNNTDKLNDITVINLPENEDEALDLILSHEKCTKVKIIGSMKEWYLDLNEWINVNEITYLDLYELTEMTEWGDPIEYVDGPSGGIYWCESLQEIILPKNLEGLGSRYFEGCTDLHTVHIPSSFSYLGGPSELPAFPDSSLKKIHLELSSNNSWILAQYSDIDVEYIITEKRFEERDGILYDIKNGKLLRCVAEIKGMYEFPKNITSVADYAFNKCRVNKIRIPAWVNELAYGIFWKAEIDELIIEEGVESLGKFMFANSNIRTLRLPSTLKEIGNESFSGINPDVEIQMDSNANMLDIQDGIIYNKFDSSAVGFIPGRKKYVVRESTKIIGRSAFSFEHSKDRHKKFSREEMIDIQLPDSLEIIQEKAFSSTPISEITLSEGLQIIEQYVFNSSYITNISIPDSVIEIGEGAFGSCSSLETVRLPIKLTKISEYLFHSCGKLETINIPNSVTTIESCAFTNCEKLIELKMPDELIEISGMAFWECRSLENVKMNEKLELLGDGAFQECVKLKSIDLPDTLTYLGSYAFWDCKSLQGIYLPPQCEIWSPDNMFQFEGCDALHDVSVSEDNPYYTIAKGILYNKKGDYLIRSFSDRNVVEPLERTKEIGPKAFENTPCKVVILPDNVRKIGLRAFADCKSLEHIRFSKNVKEITVEKYYKENYPGDYDGPFGKLFDGCDNLCEITNISKEIRETYSEVFENIKQIDEISDNYKRLEEPEVSEIPEEIRKMVNSTYFVDPNLISTIIAGILKNRNDHQVEPGTKYLNDARKLLEAIRDNLQFLGIIPIRCKALTTGLRILENPWPEEIIPSSIRNHIGEVLKIVQSGSHYSSGYRKRFDNFGYTNSNLVNFVVEFLNFNKEIHDYCSINNYDKEYFEYTYERLIYGGIKDMSASIALGVAKSRVVKNRKTEEMEKQFFVQDRYNNWQNITLYENIIFDFYRKTGKVIREEQEIRIRFKERQNNYNTYWVAEEIISIVQKDGLIDIG